jgi:hypothetical protein
MMNEKTCEFEKMGRWDGMFASLKNEMADFHNKLYEYVYIRFFELLMNWGFTDIRLMTEIIIFEIKRFNDYKRANELEIANHIRHYYKPILGEWEK